MTSRYCNIVTLRHRDILSLRHLIWDRGLWHLDRELWHLDCDISSLRHCDIVLVAFGSWHLDRGISSLRHFVIATSEHLIWNRVWNRVWNRGLSRGS